MQQIHLKDGQGVRRAPTLGEAFATEGTGESWLFISPHDDDAAIGLGMTIALAAREGFTVHVAVITDGRQGYCELAEREQIVATRRRETLEAYGLLGLAAERIHFFGYPDCALEQYTGRRPAQPGDPQVAGSTGLENSLTHLLRTIAPRRVFLPASTDIHPDHQAAHRELLISLYHASGLIWPELGPPCPLPTVYEFPTYVALAAPPDMMIETDAETLERKLGAVGAYASQRQIELVMGAIREAGPVEFIRNLRFALYHPGIYRPLFTQE